MFASCCKVSLALCRVSTALLLFGTISLSGCGHGGSVGGNGGGGGGGGGGSNPVPGIVALDPLSVAAGGPDFYVTVYGSGFVSSSVVEWNGLKLPTTFVNSTQVFAVVSAGNRSSSASVPVTVFNPSPGGGVSNAVPVFVGPVPSPPPAVGVLQLVSAAPDGTPGNGSSYTPPALSADGRYVAFQSDSTNLVPGPASGFTDIYVRDTCLGAPSGCTPTTMRVSVANDGSLPNGNSRSPAISANGRYVPFDSSATNLFPGSTQTNGAADAFVRDTCIGAPLGCTPTTTLVSVASDGSQPTGVYPSFGDSRGAAISADGRFIAFSSSATNLVPSDTNGLPDIFLRDTCLGATAGCIPSTSRISIAADGTQSSAPSSDPSISSDGRYVSFRAEGGNNLVPNDPNAPVVLHDTCSGAPSGCKPSNRDIFLNYAGGSVNGAVDNLWMLSANGRYSGFGAGGQNLDLVPGTPGGPVAAFVYDDCIGAPSSCIPHTERVSLTYNGGLANNGSGAAVISNDGNYAVFVSIADNLLSYPYRASATYVRATCTNGPSDCVPTTYLLSLDASTGIQANSSYSDYPAITPDGRYAVFISNAANWPGSLHSNGNNQVWLARVH